jgi:hypothetical protein
MNKIQDWLKKNKALISKYHQTLKKYGYVLVKLEDGMLAVQKE